VVGVRVCLYTLCPAASATQTTHSNEAVADYTSPTPCHPVTPFPLIGDVAYVVLEISSWTDIQTYRQTDRQTDRHTYIQTDRHNTMHVCHDYLTSYESQRICIDDQIIVHITALPLPPTSSTRSILSMILWLSSRVRRCTDPLLKHTPDTVNTRRHASITGSMRVTRGRT